MKRVFPSRHGVVTAANQVIAGSLSRSPPPTFFAARSHMCAGGGTITALFHIEACVVCFLCARCSRGLLVEISLMPSRRCCFMRRSDFAMNSWRCSAARRGRSAAVTGAKSLPALETRLCYFCMALRIEVAPKRGKACIDGSTFVW